MSENADHIAIIHLFSNHREIYEHVRAATLGWGHITLDTLNEFETNVDETTEADAADGILVDLTGFAVNAPPVLNVSSHRKKSVWAALLGSAAQRTLAAELGASEYFLLPLDHWLEQTRLRTWLRRRREHNQMLAEVQASMTQDAFVGLIARMIGQKLDTVAIINRTLEQAMPLFRAVSGAIWLVTENQPILELSAFLSARTDFNPTRKIAVGKGLIGWVAAHRQPINVLGKRAVDDPRYDVILDNCICKFDYPFLIVPLKHDDTTIGVLSLCADIPHLFSERQITLLSSICDLAAAAILNARLLNELRAAAAQQRALLEMSQQIFDSLDLAAISSRALQWSGRLCESESVLLWLMTPDAKKLTVQAQLGLEDVNIAHIQQSPHEPLFADVALAGQTMVYNNLQPQTQIAATLKEMLHINPKNALMIPLRYQGLVTGFLTLLNKIGGDFNHTDIMLLSTAGEMIGIAMGNAHLYTQTVALLRERERLTQHALHAERLATVGRLTGSLAHEINNPMQAIRGALTLALEDLSDIEEVQTFVQMSLAETTRVVQLVNRMRQIYRPEQDAPENLTLTDLLNEAASIATKELRRQDVTLQLMLPTEPLQIFGVANQLHLVFLGLLLNFADSLGEIGGGTLTVRVQKSQKFILITFTTTVAIFSEISWLRTFESGLVDKDTNSSFGSALSRDIMLAHGGKAVLQAKETVLTLAMYFPAVEAE